MKKILIFLLIILTSAGVGKDLWASVAILNGMALEAKPPQGQLVKVVR